MTIVALSKQPCRTSCVLCLHPAGETSWRTELEQEAELATGGHCHLSPTTEYACPHRRPHHTHIVGPATPNSTTYEITQWHPPLPPDQVSWSWSWHARQGKSYTGSTDQLNLSSIIQNKTIRIQAPLPMFLPCCGLVDPNARRLYCFFAFGLPQVGPFPP